LQAADLEVFDQHVRPRREPPHDLAPTFAREIGDDRALAAVAAVEISCSALAVGLDERRPPAARVVAFRALDLDDVGAEIGQCLPDPRAGQNARELDDPDSGKRAHAFDLVRVGPLAPPPPIARRETGVLPDGLAECLRCSADDVERAMLLAHDADEKARGEGPEHESSGRLKPRRSPWIRSDKGGYSEFPHCAAVGVMAWMMVAAKRAR